MSKTLEIYHAALRRVQGTSAVAHSIEFDKGRVYIGKRVLPAGVGIYVMGAGKAACAMAQGLVNAVRNPVTGGLLVTQRGYATPVTGMRVLEASHPVPDESSLLAGEAILAEAARIPPEQAVVFLLSGGASALMEALTEGVSLADLQQVTRLLLLGGADIHALNSVRSCLSRIKCGGLGTALAGRRVVCLVMSDVPGNPLEVIGSGPCVNTHPNPGAAITALNQFGIKPEQFPGVFAGVNACADARHTHRAAIRHDIVAELDGAMATGFLAARRLGLKPIQLRGGLQGEARDAGATLGKLAAMLPSLMLSIGRNCFITGGETTVTVTGPGRGGRCLEIGAAAALVLQGIEGVELLAAGTDGLDGTSGVAGCRVDGQTAQKAAAAGFPLEKALAMNDTLPALAAANALITTGPTGANVNDLVIAATEL